MNIVTEQPAGDDVARRVFAARTRLLYTNATLSTLISLINAGLVFFILWNTLPKKFLLIWLGGAIVIAIVRVGLYKVYWFQHGDRQAAGRWFRLYMAGALGNGFLWGILIYMGASQDTLWVEGFIAFVTAGMATGGLITMAPALSICIPYLLLVMAPLAVALLGYNDLLRQSMGALVVLYIILLSRSAFRFNQIQLQSIRMQLESDDMFDFLRSSHKETEALRQSLAAEVDDYGQLRNEREQLFEYCPDPLCVIGRDGMIDLANPALQRAAGMDMQTLRTQAFTDLMHPDDSARVHAALNRISRGQHDIAFRCRMKVANDYITYCWHAGIRDDRLYVSGRHGDDIKPEPPAAS